MLRDHKTILFLACGSNRGARRISIYYGRFCARLKLYKEKVTFDFKKFLL